MNCPSCGTSLKDEWRFCPRCGSKKRENFFDSLMSRFRREMEHMDKDMEFGSVDVSDMLKPGVQGFTIRISSGDGMEPKVEVESVGDVDRKEIERQMKQMGVEVKQTKQSKAKMPEKTEEPETRVSRSGSGVVIQMDLPGVSEKDIKIHEFESSVEVRAIGKGRAFFKIVTKPENASVRSSSFRDGKLILEVG